LKYNIFLIDQKVVLFSKPSKVGIFFLGLRGKFFFFFFCLVGGAMTFGRMSQHKMASGRTIISGKKDN
jgi:hypothetical protein